MRIARTFIAASFANALLLAAVAGAVQADVVDTRTSGMPMHGAGALRIADLERGGALLLAASPAVAHDAKGSIADFLDFTPRGTQPGLVHALLGTSECSTCHANAPDETHYPYTGWSGSMMANATRDPLFWAALDVANHDGASIGAAGIGDYCLRCHSPSGWHGGRVRKVADVDPSQPVDDALVVDGADGCLLQGDHDDSELGGNDYRGIDCEFCHRVRESGPGGEPLLIGNAATWLDDGDCGGAGQPCRAGPYEYPTPLPGGGTFDEPPHAWAYSALHGRSELCGTCHDVTSPVFDDGTALRTLIVDDGSNAGHDTGIAYPAERTYSEWAASDYAFVVFRDGLEPGGSEVQGQRLARGAECQTCHMPQAEPTFPEQELLACFFGPPRNGDLATHGFVGANTWVPDILEGELPGLGRSLAFDQAIARATELLAERSATVDVDAELDDHAEVLSARVRVTNLAGHKLPTGYAEGRRMWLQIDVHDDDGALVWSNGHWNADTGALQVDAQTKVYEIKQGIWDATAGECATTDDKGREQFHFVLNDCVAKDNRIPPLGFRGGDDPEMAAYGYAYPETSEGSGVRVNHDDTEYVIPVPGPQGAPYQVTATLRFQIASREYVEFLRDEAVENGFAAENDLCAGGPGRPFDVGPQDRSRGQYVYDLWSSPQYGRSPPVDMASASTIAHQPSVP